MSLLASAIEQVDAERGQQDAKWGEQNHDDGYWLGILAEEFGEVGKAMIEGHADLMRVELVQVAAVAVAWIECLDRNTHRPTRSEQSLEGAAVNGLTPVGQEADSG